MTETIELVELILYISARDWKISRGSQGCAPFRAAKRLPNAGLTFVDLDQIDGNTLATLKSVEAQDARKLSSAQYSRRLRDADYQ